MLQLPPWNTWPRESAWETRECDLFGLNGVRAFWSRAHDVEGTCETCYGHGDFMHANALPAMSSRSLRSLQ